SPVDWLTNHPLLSVILMVAWQWLPFACLIFITSLQSLDRDQMEAAGMDGANALQKSWLLTLPHLGRPTAVVATTQVIFLLHVFPLIWLVLTAFKTEMQAIAVPPQLFFTPTLESFREVNLRSDYLHHAANSVVTSFVSTLLGLAIAAPAAYSMAFFRTRRTR